MATVTVMNVRAAAALLMARAIRAAREFGADTSGIGPWFPARVYEAEL